MYSHQRIPRIFGVLDLRSFIAWLTYGLSVGAESTSSTSKDISMSRGLLNRYERKTLNYVLVVCIAACVVQAQRIPEENRPTRTIYIGAVEVDWDYAPEGNQLGPGADE